MKLTKVTIHKYKCCLCATENLCTIKKDQKNMVQVETRMTKLGPEAMKALQEKLKKDKENLEYQKAVMSL